MEYFLAILPILVLIVVLVFFKKPGYIACSITLVVACILALTYWKMSAKDVATSTVEGFAAALWPILLIIIAAMFTYNLAVKSGAMTKIKSMLAGVSSDRRVQMLLIAWGFGGFLEGIAGFGTAIAIPAVILIEMGMNPVSACLACMLANSIPTAFGAVGVPTVTLASITGLDSLILANAVALQMLPIMILLPFMIMFVGGGGFKAFKGMILITLVSGLAFALPVLLAGMFLGPDLPVIVGSLVAMGATLLMARLLKNKPIPQEYQVSLKSAAVASPNTETVPLTTVNVGGGGVVAKQKTMSPLMACLPFILIFIFLLLTSRLLPPINSFFAKASSSWHISTSSKAGATTFAWINTPGVWIFLSAIIFALALRMQAAVVWQTLVATLKQLYKTVITIMTIIAAAKVMTYSGMITDLADILVKVTGRGYVFFAPIIASLGAFVTGSGTNAQVLFGTLQTEAALASGVSQYWLAASNAMSAGIGKVMSPQCIATATAAADLKGQESLLLKRILIPALILLVITCLWIGLGIGLSPK